MPESRDTTREHFPDEDLEEAAGAAEQHSNDATARFGRGHGRQAIYIFLGIAVGVVALNFVLRAGADLQAPTPTGEAAPEQGGHAPHDVVWKLLLATAVIILAARVFGALARKVGQPQVVGEIVAGIALGPSLFGLLWPSASGVVFGDDVLPFLEIMAQVGLWFFMFLIGVEFDPKLIKGRGSAAVAVSHASIVIPFILGAALALVVFPDLGSERGDFTPFALFLGASMSITAFPVLARILSERGLHKTRLGTVTLTCAAVDDVTAWCVLAVVVALASAGNVVDALPTVALAVVFIVAMVRLVRPALQRVADHYDEHGQLSGTALALVFVGLLLSALATDRIGIHAIFGAFLFGAIMPQHSALIEELTTKLEDFAVLFFLPLFFAFSGLRTEVGLLGTDPQLWLYCGLILAVAIAGKWGGSTAVARLMGLTWRESMALGVLMNCRGLTELVILNIGLDLGVLPPTLFTMLVIMALVTTFMTTPALARVYPKEEQRRMVAEEGGGDEDAVWRTVVVLPNLRKAHRLLTTAITLAPNDGTRNQIVLLRPIEYSPSLFGEGGRRRQSRTEQAKEGLRPLVDFVEGAGYEAVPLVVESRSVPEAVAAVAAQQEPDIVLMSWRRALHGDRLIEGPVGEVLRQAPSDVAVIVDPTDQGITLKPGDHVLVPFGGGFHEQAALALALRLAKSHGASLRLIGDSHSARSTHLARMAREAYERSGVEATASLAPGDVVVEAIGAADEADLVVLGVSDEWADREQLGRLREALATSTHTPILLVRRHGQRRRRGLRRWFGPEPEWMEQSTGPQPAVSAPT